MKIEIGYIPTTCLQCGAKDQMKSDNAAIIHKTIRCFSCVKKSEAEKLEKENSMPFDYCPSCGNELDTGWECLTCKRDWRDWAVMKFDVAQVASE